MQLKAFKTNKITVGNDLYQILDRYLPKLEEKSIVAVTSKIVAICEGRMVKIESAAQKDRLARQEAEYYIPRELNKHHYMITITNGIIGCSSAGVDESNGNGYYVLWPKNPQQSACEIREYLIKKQSLSYLGVIITDSKSTMLRLGVTGIAISHSGFNACNSYAGKRDVFGRQMHGGKSNVADSLATSAVAEMGEGDEQTPLAVITNISFVHFQKHNPTKRDLDAIEISLQDDVFAPLLTAVKWQKGKS